MKAHSFLRKIIVLISFFAFVLIGLLWMPGPTRADTSCMDLADIPLDTQEQTAPGIVMFLLDDSGSMDWSTMCDPNIENDGVFKGYEYVFANPGDDAYTRDPYDDNLEGSSSDMKWMSQWSGYNKMFYDPTAYYAPWPGLSNADVNNPRSNPMNSGDTFNMNSTYYHEFEASSTTLSDQDIRDAGGIIVDDSDAAEETASEIELILDNDNNHNDPNVGSFSQSGSWYLTVKNDEQYDGVGYNYLYQNATGVSVATWTFVNLEADDDFKLSVWYVAASNRGTNITYTLTDSGGNSQSWDVDQQSGGGGWVLLAENISLPAGTATVQLSNTCTLLDDEPIYEEDCDYDWVRTNDSRSCRRNCNSCQRWCRDRCCTWEEVCDQVQVGTNEADRACADAVKLVHTVEIGTLPEKDFVATFDDDDGIDDPVDWYAYWETGSAYAHPGDTEYAHLAWYVGDWGYYQGQGEGLYKATWTANYLDTEQVYDVFVHYPVDSRFSTSVQYEVLDDNTVIDTSDPVNQQENGDDWVKIADDLTFSSNIGKVYLEHEATGDYSWVVADAVAFVPTQADTVVSDIARPHFYVQTDTDTFLVNLLNNNIEYYRVNLSSQTNSDESVTKAKLSKLVPTDPTDALAIAALDQLRSNRDYDHERQNFANWYSFYRRRELTAKNAIANVVDTMSGVYIGFVSINGNLLQRALPVDVTIDTVPYNEKQTLLDLLYAYNSNGGTPLRKGLQTVGLYFQGDTMQPESYDAPLYFTPMSSTSYPYFKADKGGICQQAFAIAMTDGYWNGDSPGVGNTDEDGTGDFDGGEFADDHDNTLADVAMYYYENDLNTSLHNDVPVNNADSNDMQHLVTYTVSFGVNGSIDRDNYPSCPFGEGTCPDWPDPDDGEKYTVDDLYHAAINGRGQYIGANNPMDLRDALEELKQDIESRLGAASALATNSIQRQVGSVIYQGTYHTASWFGEVAALPVDLHSGQVGSADDPGGWRASDHIPDWADRHIFSYNGSGGIVFAGNNLTAGQAALLEANGLGAEADAIVDFIRGDTSNTTTHGGPFRVRLNPIGDVVHSAPVYHKGVVYIGANDGMLHAIDATNGHELFCYVPNLVYDHLSELAHPGYSHKYYVDNPPHAASIGGTDLLVGGLRKGGKGYFCLDVTTPTAMAADDVLWEYPSGTDDDLGYTYSRAFIVHTEAAGWVVIFGNGYDSVNGQAILYVLYAEGNNRGTVVKKLYTDVTGCNGLATPAVIDVEFDGNVDYAYAGDLKGNMWKFDLRGESVNDWDISYKDGEIPMPLISLKNSDNQVQPITVSPEVRIDCAQGLPVDGFQVIFGTGRYLSSDDFSNFDTQSLYGIWDWQPIWEYIDENENTDTAKHMYLGTFEADRTLSNISSNLNLSEVGRNVTLLQQTLDPASTSDWRIFSDNPIYYYDPIKDEEIFGVDHQHAGWYFDLPTLGERSIRDPALREDVVVILSTIPSDSPCEAGGSSFLYQINSCTGGRVDADTPKFDVDGDYVIDSADLIDGKAPTGQFFDQILFEPIELGDRMYLPDSQGQINGVPIVPEPPGMSYWRVIQ